MAVALWVGLASALMLAAADFRIPASASWGDLGLVALTLALPVAFVGMTALSVSRVVRALS